MATYDKSVARVERYFDERQAKAQRHVAYQAAKRRELEEHDAKGLCHDFVWDGRVTYRCHYRVKWLVWERGVRLDADPRRVCGVHVRAWSEARGAFIKRWNRLP